MATPDYSVNYDDNRFTEVNADKKAALNEVNQTYNSMVINSDKYYQKQIDAAQDYADKQAQIQQEKTDFAIEQINQQKAQAKQDYTKEQSGAYVDWQKQSNQYGANAEQMAAQGMANTGFSESSQVSMYNTYQNRVATAREAYTRAVLNYDNMIKDARLQNNAALAEIAYNSLQKQLELSLAGFQYKNDLIIAKSDKKLQVDEIYHDRWQDVLNQINTEHTLAETVRQYNENMAFKEKEYQEGVRQFNAQLAEQKRQFNVQQAEKQRQQAKASTQKTSGSKVLGVVKKVADAIKNAAQNKTPAKEQEVENKHGDSWIYIPGHGRFSWAEVYAYVEDGQIKETKTNDGKLRYTWVNKPAKNVTPDEKGYAAKQRELLG